MKWHIRMPGTIPSKTRLCLSRFRKYRKHSADANLTSQTCIFGVVHFTDASAGRGAAKPRQVTLNGIIYSDKVRDLSDLRDDEDAAAAEALAQGGRPGYCGDRYFKAAAGGHYCDKFDRPSR